MSRNNNSIRPQYFTDKLRNPRFYTAWIIARKNDYISSFYFLEKTNFKNLCNTITDMVMEVVGGYRFTGRASIWW